MESVDHQRIPASRPITGQLGHTSSVKDASPRATACHWGKSPEEVRRLCAITKFFSRQRVGREPMKFSLIVVGDALLDMPELAARALVRTIKSDIMTELRRAGLPGWILEVVESTGGYHVNLIVPTWRGIEKLRDRKYGHCLASAKAIREVEDWAGLASYLSKERTPQAQYAVAGITAREPGSHKLETKASGDRVNPSKALKAELKDILKSYRRSYAKPKPISAEYAPAREADQPGASVIEPQLVAVNDARTGSWPRQLSLFGTSPPRNLLAYEGGRMPRPVADEIEDWRRDYGLTQERLAAEIGISRPQLVNVIVGRFGLSPKPAARLRELVAA